MAMTIVAFDPGTTGAVAILGDQAKVFDLPTVELPGEGRIRNRVHGPALYKLLMDNLPPGAAVFAVAEALTYGGQDNMVQTSVSQGRTRGAIEATIELMGLELHEVGVKAWKKMYGLTNEKHASLSLARRLYPDLAGELKHGVNHNRAEAVLIAHYARKVLV